MENRRGAMWFMGGPGRGCPWAPPFPLLDTE